MSTKRIDEILNEKMVVEIDRFEARLLLAHILKVNIAATIAFPEKTLSSKQIRGFLQAVSRRARGEPIAYILKKKEFWSEMFEVNSATLIPRPETELLIETVLTHFDTNTSYQFLELGSGSGIIGIILAKLFPTCFITAVDNSREALKTAKKNQKNHGVKNIRFIYSDWYEAIKKEKQFDLIISNPPYLAENDFHLHIGDLRYEPKSALISGETGFESFISIITDARFFLKENGVVMLEHGFDQHQKVQKIFLKNGFDFIEVKQDIHDLPRVTTAKLSGIRW